MASNFDPEDAEACVRAVECDTFDQTGKRFAILGGTVGNQAIHDAQSSTVDTAVPACASGEALLTGELRYTVRKHATRETELQGHSCGRVGAASGHCRNRCFAVSSLVRSGGSSLIATVRLRRGSWA